MSAPPLSPSIRDLTPLDLGGIEARDGFALQDHIAAGFCLDMVVDATLLEVWCENHDDITLIWNKNGELVEFVQVKGSDLNQLWTVAKLCEREKSANGQGRCILEKSLHQDRCREPCRFRLVTTRPVADELKILTLPIGAPGRVSSDGVAAMTAVCEALKPRVAGSISQNGNDYTFWAANANWDIRHAEDSVHDANILKLHGILESLDTFLATDQVEELYNRLLRKVWDASRARPDVTPELKRISSADFLKWLTEAAKEINLPGVGAADKVRDKMTKAQLATDVINSALEQKRFYRHESLSQKYLENDDQRLVQGEVTALLQRLRSQLDNGKLADDGIAFHALCLEELERLRTNLLTKTAPTSAFVQGCMYSLTGRCLHRFRRVSA